eukprot:SAG11_NODE_317_length_10836_cov_7.445469_10_plen_248_part_00
MPLYGRFVISPRRANALYAISLMHVLILGLCSTQYAGPGVQIRYRPHAVYNPNTKMYVLWYDWRNKGGGYGDNNHSAQGAAVSVKPGGPFVVVTPNATLAGPIDYRGDLDVFVDDDADHTAYLIYTAGSAQTMTIEQLSKNYTTSTLRSTWDPSGASKEDGGGYQAATGCGPYTRQGSCGSAAARDANSTDYWNTLSGGLLHLGVDAGWAHGPILFSCGTLLPHWGFAYYYSLKAERPSGNEINPCV